MSPGTPSAPDAHPTGEPTVHEFLSRLVHDPDTRTAFEADPSASLHQAGLGDMTTTDVLQAASLALDHAPVDVAEEYGRALQSSVEQFAVSTQHVAINHLHPQEQFELGVEPNMLNNVTDLVTDFTSTGDVDNLLTPSASENNATGNGFGNINIGTDQNHDHNHDLQDSQNFINAHDFINIDGGSGDAVSSVANTVGDVAFGTVSQVDRKSVV